MMENYSVEPMRAKRCMREYLIRLCDDSHMVFIGIPILLATVFYFKCSKETELRNTPVVQGEIVSCRPMSYGESCIADVEFRIGSGRLRRRSVKVQNQKNCVVGQTVKIQYSIHSNLIEIIE